LAQQISSNRSKWSRGLWFRLVGSVLLSVGLGLLLRPHDLPYWAYLLACGFVGVGAFLLAEGAGFRKKREGSAKQAPESNATSVPTEGKAKVEAEPSDKAGMEMMRGLMAAALVILVALCLWVGSLWKASYQAQNQIERELIALLARPVPGPGPANTGLQLNPDLEKVLIDYFRNPPQPTEGLPWFLVAIGAVAAVLLFATKKNKEAAPVIAVIPLAAAAIKYSEHLSKFSTQPFKWVVIGSIGIAVGLMALAIFYWFMGPQEEKRKVVTAIFTMGFSVLILLWTFLLVAWCSDCPITTSGGGGTPPDPGPPKPGSWVVKLNVDRLEPLPLFNSGKSITSDKKTSFSKLESQLKGSFQPGDLLLLFGSTDCVRYSKGNDTLASERAIQIRDQLMHSLKPDDIKLESITQNDQCKEKQDTRAVFPFLVHGEISKP
jgi:hypothetical protein